MKKYSDIQFAIILFFLLFHLSDLLAEQTGNIEGFLIDRQTNELIIDATIVMYKGSPDIDFHRNFHNDKNHYKTTTNSSGEFTFNNVPIGTYNIIHWHFKNLLVKMDIEIYPDLTNYVLITSKKHIELSTEYIGRYGLLLNPYAKLHGTIYDKDFNIIDNAKLHFKNTILKDTTDKLGEYNFTLYFPEEKRLLVQTKQFPIFEKEINLGYHNYELDIVLKDTLSKINIEYLEKKRKKILQKVKKKKDKYSGIKRFEHLKSSIYLDALSYKNEVNEFTLPPYGDVNHNLNFDKFSYRVPVVNNLGIHTELGKSPWDENIMILVLGINTIPRKAEKLNFFLVVDVNKIEENYENFCIFREQFVKYLQTRDKTEKVSVLLVQDYEYPFFEDIQIKDLNIINDKLNKINPHWISEWSKSDSVMQQRYDIAKFENDYNAFPHLDETSESLKKLANLQSDKQEMNDLAVKYKVFDTIYRNYNPNESNILITVDCIDDFQKYNLLRNYRQLKFVKEKETFIDHVRNVNISNKINIGNLFYWQDSKELFEIFNNLEYNYDEIVKDFTLHAQFNEKLVSSFMFFNPYPDTIKYVDNKTLIFSPSNFPTNFQYTTYLLINTENVEFDTLGTIYYDYIDQKSSERIYAKEDIVLNKRLSNDFHFVAAIAECKTNNPRNWDRIISSATKGINNSELRKKLVDGFRWRYNLQQIKKARDSK